jgi:hypothetical protein
LYQACSAYQERSLGPFTIYMLLVSAMDNILKPFLMSRGLQAPMLAILAGVVGGESLAASSRISIEPLLLCSARCNDSEVPLSRAKFGGMIDVHQFSKP